MSPRQYRDLCDLSGRVVSKALTIKNSLSPFKSVQGRVRELQEAAKELREFVKRLDPEGQSDETIGE